MCSELPKDFQKTTEVLPFTKYGLSSIEDFKKAEKEIENLEWLKKIGLSSEEVHLYQQNEAGLLDQCQKVESGILKSKLEAVYNKINDSQAAGSSKANDEAPSTSTEPPDNIIERLTQAPMKIYPKGHPMNELKDLEESLFGNLKDSNISITKRRKMLRRLERKKERVLAQQNNFCIPLDNQPHTSRPGSLWDVKEVTPNTSKDVECDKTSGPKIPTMYTIKDNKIMRLEPLQRDESDEERGDYQAVDIVMPMNAAEEQLLEGTKMSLDDIKKIERFKDYEPGIPSKVLFLKNISPSVSHEQLSLLFNQFLLDNGGPVDVRLLSGRMRGQAFVTFQKEDLAIQALEEVNGTILSGRPIIAQFGRNSNRIQIEENR